MLNTLIQLFSIFCMFVTLSNFHGYDAVYIYFKIIFLCGCTFLQVDSSTDFLSAALLFLLLTFHSTPFLTSQFL